MQFVIGFKILSQIRNNDRMPVAFGRLSGAGILPVFDIAQENQI